MKKFYAVIGNPPYQEDSPGNQRKSPVYHSFMDESYQVAEKVELITPARFLFNAGQTPKEWNRKMLSDRHLKVEYYTPNGEVVFPTMEIKGGVAITYRDAEDDHSPIETFVPFEEMTTVLNKVKPIESESLSSIVIGAVPYRFSDQVRLDRPELKAVIGDSFDLRTNAFDKLGGELFFRSPLPGIDCVAVYGLANKKREYLWIRRNYIEVPNNFEGYKVLIPKASGNGDYGESLGESVVAGRRVGHTQSFISMGNFQTENEALALSRYIETKFARSLLGLHKVTQDITPRVWECVPLQDFTPSSDIDWSKPVAAIDQQLYKKYGLSDDEISFIESHVKEMA